MTKLLKNMWRILSLVLMTVMLLITCASPAVAALQTIKTPTPPIDINESQTISLQSGTSTYSYQIQVAPGTNGLQPSVSLNYNSAATLAPLNQVGAGWSLSQNYIERDVRSTPNNTADDVYKLHLNSATYDLVYIPSLDTYQAKVNAYFQLKKHATGGQGASSAYWELKTTDGTTYRFGYNPDSQTACSGRVYQSAWHLDQTTDTNGNNVYYVYFANDGMSYLSNIKYNNDQTREVLFNYEGNQQTKNIFVQGCQVSPAQRLSNIQVNYAGGLVREYDLAYSQAPNEMSLLGSIAEKGSDGSSLPPVTFSYNTEVHQWNTTYENWITNAPIQATVLMDDVEVADVTGDGLPDIVKTKGYGGPADEWEVFKNTGTSWETTPEIWLPRTANLGINLIQDDVILVDATGDGLPDIIKTKNYGGPADEWEVYVNTGSDWNTVPEIWISRNANLGIYLLQADVRVIDVTGDGLPDIIKTKNYGGPADEWEVYVNTGSSWNTTPQIWLPRTANLGINLLQGDVRVIDVNGDGLADVIKTKNYGGPATEWEVYRNTGSNWEITPEIWISRTANAEIYLLQNDVTFADANGDGLQDIIRSVNFGGPNNEWWVYLNKGNRWDTNHEVWVSGIPFEANLLFNDIKVADFNGDGLTDILRVYSDGGPNYTWRVWLNKGSAPDLLDKIHAPTGGVIDYDYLSALTFNNTSLAFPIYVVTQVTKSNGMTNSQSLTQVSTYSYANGLYNYAQDQREFRGFGEVYEIAPNSAKTTYSFNQGDDNKGKLSQFVTTDAQGNLYTQEDYDWASLFAEGVYTTTLTSKKSYTYDGVATNPKISQTDYQYDQYGNVTRSASLGDQVVSGDERYLYTEFVYNPTDWIVSKPKHTYLRGQDDIQNVAESWFYYDDAVSIDTLPATGNLTKEEKWNDQGVNPISTYTYDSYGNKTSVTDPNSHTTQYIYGLTDTTFTFPEKIINAKLQETQNAYDLATGNMLSTTDPNGFVTNYEYDPFGRKTKEIKPYDSDLFPTVGYTYDYDGVAPEGVKVSQRLDSGLPSTYDVYTFVDGFGRTIQTRKPAEDPLKQIVSDSYYDLNGEEQKISNPYQSDISSAYTDPAQIAFTSKLFDPIKRVVQVTNPDQTSSSFAYDHWKATITDENGNATINHTDAYGQTQKVQEITSTDVFTTDYESDPQGNLTKITDDQGNLFSFIFDSLGRKVQTVDPDIGTWNYVFDGVGNQISVTDNRGITTSLQYDELNRVRVIDYPSDTDVVYVYDQPTVGTLSNVADAAGTTTYQYDSRLRKTNQTKTIETQSWNTSYTYDSADRLLTQTNPDGEVLTYTYNNQGEISSLSGILNQVDYNEINKVTKKFFSNGLNTNYTYNPVSFRLSNITTLGLQDLDYTYDNVGNVETITDVLKSTSRTYAYDKLNRLISATQDGPSAFSRTYAYDSIGNILSILTDNGLFSYFYDGLLPHAISTYETPDTGGPTNIAFSGTAYRWFANTSSTSDANKVAEPLLNDDLEDISINLSSTSPDTRQAWEAAGVIWASGQSITSVEFVNGSFDTLTSSGVFAASFGMQYTTDGTTWVDSAWTCTPAYQYDSASAADTTYACLGTPLSAMGVRIVGQVRVSRNGTGYANAKEVRAFSEPVAPTFSGLSENLTDNQATFNFTYSGSSTNYVVDVATSPDMQANTYLGFASGTSSPITETNPTKWSAYVCDTPVYWQVSASDGTQSDVQSSTITCSTGNIALSGTAYRWSANSNSTSDANKVAEPLLNDDLEDTDVRLSSTPADPGKAWEAAGIVWQAVQQITSVEFVNGNYSPSDGSGVFSANFGLQYTTDGTTWVNSGWNCIPVYQYDSASAANTTYTCTGTTPLSGIGIRLTGQVSLSRQGSRYANAKEVRAF